MDLSEIVVSPERSAPCSHLVGRCCEPTSFCKRVKGGSAASECCVSRNGVWVYPNIVPVSSRIFNVDGVEFKWKSGTEAPDGINTHNHAYHDVWKIWRCVSSRLDPSTTSSTPSIALPVMRSPYPAAATDTAAQPVQTPEGRPTLALDTSFLSEPHHDQRSQPSASAARSILSAILNAPAPPTILARFAPPQIGLEHNELSLFPQPLSDQRANDHFLECLLISTVILAVRKGEWKQVQTVVGVSALQAVFMAEAVGEVPPYTPRSRQAASTAGGNTRTVRSRAHSDRSRRPPEVMAGARPNPSENHGQANDSDQTPLLPQRNAHRSSRSSPFNIFPTPPFNLGTISGQARRAFFPGPGHDRPASNRVASRRPATADSAFAGDGVFNRRRPSLQVANPAYVPRSGDLVAAPGMGSPPPAYS